MSQELESVQPGCQIGPYRVVRRFKSRSGMARLFEVEVREKYRQQGLPRRLALKVAREEHQAALSAEADYLSRFDHPNVVRIYPLPGYHRPVYAAREHFPFGWGWYYAMELVLGGSLDRHLSRPTTITDLLRPPPTTQRQISLLEVIGMARQLASALAHIHERAVINLDIKPGNILFRRRRLRYLRSSVPAVVLCDFGIARDLRYPRQGLLGVATPEYVSPEQASELGRERAIVDARSDIFSLGVVMYEMLTGNLPFENIALVVDPTYLPIPPRQLRPSIPPELDYLVMRALAKNPAHRFQSAAEMLAALQQLRMPLDWGAAARRTFVGLALSAALVGGGWGTSVIIESTPTPTTTTEATLVPPTNTLPPPTTVVPSTTPRARSTSTPAPTSTPTNTPRPPTATPTPAPGRPTAPPPSP